MSVQGLTIGIHPKIYFPRWEGIDTPNNANPILNAHHSSFLYNDDQSVVLIKPVFLFLEFENFVLLLMLLFYYLCIFS